MFRFFRKKRQEHHTPKPEVPKGLTLNEALLKGDYQQALATLDTETRTNPEPNKLFMAIGLRGFLEDFHGALADLELLAQLLPDKGLRDEFGHVFVNGQQWVCRQTVPGFASRRASLGALPPEYAAPYAEAMQLHAEGRKEEAKAKLEEAKSQAPKAGGELFFVDDCSMTFDDLRDADELTGPFLTCSHPEGLLDIPFAQIAELAFFRGGGYQDRLWRPARVTMWSGEEALVRVYSYYVGTGHHALDGVRQLVMTLSDHQAGYAVAVGQRDWQLLSDEEVGSVALVGTLRVDRVVFRCEGRP